ncbi:MAG: uracil-DNA glycosylase [Acidimicrobiia bacterium]|nr:uracil-DNA glycosylase [Acidimicrobiia bacterium]
MSEDSLARLHIEIGECRRCDRLVAWREAIATERRAAFRDDQYWGRPVTGFGDPQASVLITGLAPGAHGANRTGRAFTGDRSGDWLFAALKRTGYANQAESVSLGDGLMLSGAYISIAVRCAPPANRPTRDERDRCLPFLVRELALLPNVKVIVALGKFAFDSVWQVLRDSGIALPNKRPVFGHGVAIQTPGAVILCSYHPSQQNTFTKKLTEPMLDNVFVSARELAKTPDSVIE